MEKKPRRPGLLEKTAELLDLPADALADADAVMVIHALPQLAPCDVGTVAKLIADGRDEAVGHLLGRPRHDLVVDDGQLGGKSGFLLLDPRDMAVHEVSILAKLHRHELGRAGADDGEEHRAFLVDRLRSLLGLDGLKDIEQLGAHLFGDLTVAQEHADAQDGTGREEIRSVVVD